MQTLYLSKNCLRSLQGIQQFSSLVTLALADNLVDSFDQLDFLLIASQGHTLMALSLEGNPIARLPNYRSAGTSVAGTWMPIRMHPAASLQLAMRHLSFIACSPSLPFLTTKLLFPV